MNKNRFNKDDNNKKSGAPMWMVTFSDLMSLLLTFFILLYSMSNVDAQKFKAINASLRGVLSGIGHTSIIEVENTDVTPSEDMIDFEESPETQSNINEGILRMYETVQGYIEDENLDAKVSVNISKKGVFVDINETILFDPGSAELKPSGIEVLNKLEGLINDFKNDILIEGHTDDIPMNTAKFPSNWDLSSGRAISVLRYLSEVKDVDPTRLAAVGYGEYNPIVPNDNRENRQKNRRVNILIIFDEESDGIDGYN